MEETFWSLLPPFIMILLVLLTRRVLLSLGAGIVVGALMVESYDILGTLERIWFSFQNLFYAEGAWDIWSVQLIIFLLLLGILIAFLTATGGAQAFGQWAVNRVRTRKGSQYTTGLLGVAIFIDDYFNSLTIGQVSRPITDRQNVSRAKLAYLIDSTSAPVTVLTPISSWGAYIIGIIATIISTHELTELSALTTFVQMIPYNFYAIAAVMLVFLAIFFKLEIGPMKKHEQRAEASGTLIDPENPDVPGDLKGGVKENGHGRVYHLLLPLLVLLVTTITMMVITGIQGSEDGVTLVSTFANTDVNLSLVLGGTLAVILSMILYAVQPGEKTNFFSVTWEGIKAMLPAVYILILAWMIVAIIEAIGTDDYLVGIVEEASLNAAYLPVMIFLIAGVTAFATGTSWGTFGLMLPIAGSMAVELDPTLLVPALSAVLAGSVFGDHCSPISDTSVLSSTGAGSNHIDHIVTQIPYALIAATSTILGYLAFALTSSVIIGLVVTIAILIGIVLLLKNK
ncbi:Na+/H+ antiporter NhaC family protein [Alkalibacillus salilacus]|uniref:Na+/H+ antiporter NhaC n=1 Tax=Alkalibacillus salilacus TaxID=284582 RepID=A0ABT9VEY6_9BACI|nr:Na+/H+ antiporter NhaC family protein [Alkalibacillus salilacus]MDQ0159518.1 Na+/H+ antiporter NhaC [Alkalibacillus salilacus]